MGLSLYFKRISGSKYSKVFVLFTVEYQTEGIGHWVCLATNVPQATFIALLKFVWFFCVKLISHLLMFSSMGVILEKTLKALIEGVENGQQLRTLVILPEDSDWDPGTHVRGLMTASSFSFRRSKALFRFPHTDKEKIFCQT